MPREVCLPPGGSPFVHNTSAQRRENFDTDTSLPDLSSRYFRASTAPDNLNSSRALAGLEDISTDMAEDDSPMKFRASVSDELLMGVKGGEFLADDSAMGFDNSLVSKPFESRSKLNRSTTIPVAVNEEPEPIVEQPMEKPKRKKSTRSRSKSPTKKNTASEPGVLVAEEAGAFPVEPAESAAKAPESEHQALILEPEIKPRRTSPRKARTQSSASSGPPLAFAASSSVAPTSNPFSSSAVSTTASEATLPVQPAETGVQVPSTTKQKMKRTVGRSKSKTMSKNSPSETDQESRATPSDTLSEAAPVERPEGIHQVAHEGASRSTSTDMHTTAGHTSSAVATERTLPLTFVDTYLGLAKTSNLDQPASGARTEPGPAPFKFQTRPSIANSRRKSHAVTAVGTPTETPVLSTPEPTTPEETPKEPTKEEEAEAVESALRILRRDSSIFPRLRLSIAPDAVPGFPRNDGSGTIQEPTGAQAEPIHKRTRVGRASTRPRGGMIGPTKMNQVAEERFDIPAADLHVQPQPPTDEPNGTDEMDVENDFEPKEDIIVPVNFGSRTPSPGPPPVSTDSSPLSELEPEPEPRSIVSDIESNSVERPISPTAPHPSPPLPTPVMGTSSAPVKPQAMRASLPVRTTRVSAPATRSARMSEGRPPVTRSIGSARKVPTAIQEKEDEPGVGEKSLAADTIISDSMRPAEVLSKPSDPAATAEDSITLVEPQLDTEPGITSESRLEPEPEPIAAADSVPASKSSSVQRKTLDKGVPQRVASQTTPIATMHVSSDRNDVSEKQPTQTKFTTAPARTQRTAAAGGKPNSATSVVEKPALNDRSTQVVPQASVPVLSKQVKPSSNRTRAKSKPEGATRPTRTMPKRASVSRRQREDAIPSGNASSSSQVEQTNEQPRDQTAVATKEPSPEPTSQPIRVGPFEHKHRPFQPVLNRPTVDDPLTGSRASPQVNKRRASPETDPELPILDSPSKRVRFSAELEAGPTPRAVRTQIKPKPSLKPFAKPLFKLKASRPKRTLTRNDSPPGTVPSYAAPLRRQVSEKASVGIAETERLPLSETRTNATSTANKLKPTVPVEFTFRSELRMKPPVEVPLSNAIPIAMPMPDFAAAHAAAEAANLARRERTQAAFLAAQEELAAWRESKHEIGSETARRAAERAVFNAALKVKEAEAERERLEAKRLEDEREATEIRELRKRMVPKANPLPEWYKHIGQADHGDEDRVES